MIKKIISTLFSILFFLTPLIFFPKTSELFEFNKLIFIYLVTILICFFWFLLSIVNKKIIFTKTVLDIPLILFLLSQIISTFFSIDQHTSIFGYYGRFYGGLLSTICMVFLYWAFVSLMDKKTAKISLSFLISSVLIVCLWGVSEHFGKSPSCYLITKQFDVSCWVQDVQNRVFATIGQPNWLAALIVAVIPIIWTKITRKKIIWLVVFGVFYLTLIFTKSRSGFLGFFASIFVYWGLIFINSFYTKKYLNNLSNFLFITFTVITLSLAFGTPWNKGFFDINFSSRVEKDESQLTLPVLERGGTESSEIRKIVWRGAYDIFTHNFLIGTGPETFAYSYYLYRPLEHNNTSEWDYLYNKAHNEYLNYAANSGIFGLGSFVLFAFIYAKNTINFERNKSKIKIEDEDLLTKFALLAGFISILVTNFFGFSVTVVGILTFLYPAIYFVVRNDSKEKIRDLFFGEISNLSKIEIFVSFLIAIYLMFQVINLYKADYFFTRARSYARQGRASEAIDNFDQSIKLVPKEGIYYSELSESFTDVSEYYFDQNDSTKSAYFANEAIANAQEATNISPRNINFKRNLSNTYIRLASQNKDYIPYAMATLNSIRILAPTDPKIPFQLGLLSSRLSQTDQAIEYFEKAILMKPDYKDARVAAALIYKQTKKYNKAKEQYEYILKYITTKDEFIKNELESLPKSP